MTTLSRRGACPTLSVPMLTGDGLLVRLNSVSGEIAPKALIGLCESALRHGNGLVEVTARGNIQIRGLTAESAALFATEVDALGITVRTGVPVETGPLAGIDPTEITDPRPLAKAIRTAIANASLTARLGPKVSIVIDGSGQIGLGTILADVRLVAVNASRWRLSMSGDEKAATFVGEFSAEAACSATLAILQNIAAIGRQARARDLGLTTVLEAIAASATSHSLHPPPFCPTGQRGGGKEDRDLTSDASLKSYESNSEPIPPTDSSPIGILPLSRNRNTLGLALPFGSIQAERLITLSEATIALGATGIRTAPGRSFFVIGLSQPNCEALRNKAKVFDFVTSPSDPRTRIAACPGAPACASGMIAARDVAAEIAQTIGLDLDPTLSLHVSGCSKGCAHPGPAALTIVGDKKSAAFVVGGTAKGLPAAYTAGYEAASGVRRLAELLAAERKPQEDATACLARLGDERLAQALGQG